MKRTNITNFIFLLIVFTLLTSLALASDFTPQGDINLRYIYNIVQGKDADFNGSINASDFVGDGSGLTNISASSINLSDVNANSSVWWVNMSAINRSQFRSDGSALTVLNSFLRSLFYYTSEVFNRTETTGFVDSLNNSKYDKSLVYNTSVSFTASEIRAGFANISAFNSLIGNVTSLDSRESSNNDTQALQISNQITQQQSDNDTLKGEIDGNTNFIGGVQTNLSNQISQQSSDNSTQANQINISDIRQAADNNTLKGEIDDNTNFIDGVQDNLTLQIAAQQTDNDTLKADIDLKLDITDQRYNNSNDATWSLNTSVLRNESGSIGIVKSWFDGVYAQLAAFLSLVGNVTTLDTRESDNNLTQAGEIASNDADITNLFLNDTSLQNQIIGNDNDITNLFSNDTSLQNQIISNDNDITNLFSNDTSLQNQIISNDGELTNLFLNDTSLQDQIISNDGDITNLFLNDTGLREDLTTLDTRESTNNITQSGEINLRLLSTDQRYNNSNLAHWGLNLSVLVNQSGNIGILGSYWSDLYQTIAVQQADNDTLAGLITTNADAITDNTNFIIGVQGNVTVNAGAISDNEGFISGVQTNLSNQISQQQADNSSIGAALTVNAGAISDNTAFIDGVQDNLTLQIAQQIADNDTLEAEIAVNVGAISDNEGFISGVQTNLSNQITQQGNDNTTIGLRLGSLEDSNTSMDGRMDLMEASNTTQSGEINLKLDITDQRYNNSNLATWGLNTTVLRNESGNIGIVGTFFSGIYQTITAQQTDNDTLAAEIVAKHTPGTCSAGEAVQNTTTTGVECFTPTDTDTDTRWALNTSVLVNQSDSIGVLDSFWSGTYQTITIQQADNDTQAAEIVLKLDASEEPNLNVNSSNYWDGLDTPLNIVLLDDVVITDVSVVNAPAVCPAGSAMTFTNMSAATCVAFVSQSQLDLINATGVDNTAGISSAADNATADNATQANQINVSSILEAANNLTQAGLITANAGAITANTGFIDGVQGNVTVNAGAISDNEAFISGVQTNLSNQITQQQADNSSIGSALDTLTSDLSDEVALQLANNNTQAGEIDDNTAAAVAAASAAADANSNASTDNTTQAGLINTALVVNIFDQNLNTSQSVVFVSVNGTTNLKTQQIVLSTFSANAHIVTSANNENLLIDPAGVGSTHVIRTSAGAKSDPLQLQNLASNVGTKLALPFVMHDDGGTVTQYGGIEVEIIDKVHPSENGSIIFKPRQDGTNTEYLRMNGAENRITASKPINLDEQVNITDVTGFLSLGSGGKLFWNSTHTCIVGPDGDVDTAICDTD